MIKPNKSPRLFGAHLSTSGGLLKTLERAQGLGCNCVQIFAGNPRSWSATPISEAAGQAYCEQAESFGVLGMVIHAIYLVNLASPKPELQAKSVQAVRKDLQSAARLHACAVVVHPGSDLGDGLAEGRILENLRALLPEIPSGCRLLLESMSGQKNSPGNLATLGRICREFGDSVGVCLDSAHLCAAGYELSQPDDFKRLLDEIDQHLGFDRVGCIHLNDSKAVCGSHRDHHENLGEGFVGQKGLMHFLHCPQFQALPFILETPGFDQLGPDALNMQRLHQYAQPVRKAKIH